jgi:glycosyltransferase involved in cell wall biosynthesis
MRLLVYTDYAYQRDEAGRLYGERAFVVFMVAMAQHVERLTLAGRLRPERQASHYAVPDDVGFLPLPHYETLIRLHEPVISMVRSITRFWRALDDVDTVWLLGPYLHAIVFVALAKLRRRRVVLGVRQDFPEYTRNRYPGKRHLHALGSGLEWIWRRLARRIPVVTVGPQLAENYADAPAVLPIAVSLVGAEDIVAVDAAATKDWSGERRILSVGRLDKEKNPLLLADILAELRRDGEDWRLIVAGDGTLREALEARLAELGVAEHADVLGYVPIDEGLGDVYRSAHALLHVSWTEGVPQVMFEAFAAGLPIVATTVGGVPGAVGEAGLLVEPGNVEQPVAALRRLADDPGLRRTLIERGTAKVTAQTIEAETARVAAFLATPDGRADGAAAGTPAGSPAS